MSNSEDGLRKAWEQVEQRADADFESRLLLFCDGCQEMTRYTADSVMWYCSECGGGDRTTEQVQEDLRRDL